MKNIPLALLLALLLPAGSVYAACKSEACRRAVGWKNGYTAIVLQDEITRNEYFAVLNIVKENNGIVAIEAERVLLGWVPVLAVGKIRAALGVRAVLHDFVSRPSDLVRSEHALSALSFFNAVVSGAYEDAVEKGLATVGQPLTGCAVDRTSGSSYLLQSLAAQVAPTMAEQDDAHAANAENIATHREQAATPRPGRGVSPNFWFREPFQNPDMRGRVTVQLFSLDSDGTLDPNLYTWTWDDYQFARNQVYGAFTFWVNQAAARNIALSFRVAISDPYSRPARAHLPMRTGYEPITRRSTHDYLWVNDALAYHGYGAAPVTNENVYGRNEAFNRHKRNDPIFGPFDRSFSVYLVYNPGSAPSTFPDGARAFAMYDGPFTVVMWNSAGWGPNNLGLVLTHETGHIFWACDEYYDARTNTGCFACTHCFFNVGPRNHVNMPGITNANCEYRAGPGVCDTPGVECIMRRSHYALCPHTPAQIGW